MKQGKEFLKRGDGKNHQFVTGENYKCRNNQETEI